MKAVRKGVCDASLDAPAEGYLLCPPDQLPARLSVELQLGRGGFAQVYRARFDGRPIA